MIAYIDKNKDRFGVEPICRVLPVAPSTYYERRARANDPDRRPPRAVRDEALKLEIQRVGKRTSASTASAKYGAS